MKLWKKLARGTLLGILSFVALDYFITGHKLPLTQVVTNKIYCPLTKKFVKDQKIRKITLCIATSQNTTKPKNLEETIQQISKDFQQKFGIEFEIKEYKKWHADQTNLYLKYFEAMREVKHNSNILLALTNYQGGGRASLLGNIVIVDYRSETFLPILIQHELSHIFGAKDIKMGDKGYDTTKSVMTYNPLNESLVWDDENAERIKNNKHRLFW